MIKNNKLYLPLRSVKTLFLTRFWKIIAPLSILMFLIVLSIITNYALQNIEDDSRNRAVNTLQSELASMHDVIKNVWVKGHNSDVLTWASDKQVILRATEKLLKIAANKGLLQRSPSVKRTRDFFNKKMKQYDLLGFYIISRDLINLASMYDYNIGEKNLIASKYKDRLTRVFQGKPQVIPPIFSRVFQENYNDKQADNYPVIFIVVPIVNPNGAIIAALGIGYNPLLDFSGIVHTGSQELSMETYAFNYSGQLLTESRFNDQLRAINLLDKQKYSTLNLEIRDPGGNLLTGFKPQIPRDKQPLTYMVKKALTGAPGYSSEAYPDYRGVPVLGAWVWDSDLGIGLATEIDELEVLQPYFNARITIIILLGFIICLTLIFYFALIRTYTKSMQSVAKNEKYLQEVLNNMFDSLITINEDGIIESFNSAAEKVFGYSLEEVIGKNVSMLMPEPHKNKHIGYLKKYFTSGESKIIGSAREETALRKDGSTFPIRLAVSEMFMGGKRIFIGMIQDNSETQKALEELKKSHQEIDIARKAALSIMQDVKDQKAKAEKALEELEISTNELKKLSSAIEQGHASIVITNKKGIIEYVNPAFLKTTGYTIDEVIGKKPGIQKSGFHNDIFYKGLWATLNSGMVWRGEFKNKKKDGDIFWESASISPIKNAKGNITHFVAVKEDITERKKTDEEIKYFNQFQTILTGLVTKFINLEIEEIDVQIDKILEEVTRFVNAESGYVFEISEDKKNMYLVYNWNSPSSFDKKGILQSLEIDPMSLWMNKLFNGKINCFSNVEDIPEKEKSVKHELLSQNIKSILDIPMIYNRQTIGFLRLTSSIEILEWKDADINLLQLVGSIITNALERKQSQNDLINEKKFLDTVLQSLPGIFYAFSRSGKFIKWNKNYEKLIGHSPEQIKEMSYLDHIYAGDLELAKESIVKVIKKGAAVTEIKVNNSEGEAIPHLLNNVRLQKANTTYIVGTGIDISERLSMEEELKKSKDIAEAATLAKSQFLATMSHEIRTPINAIIGLNRLLYSAGLSEKQRDYAVKTQIASQSLLGIINNILDFSKIEAGKLDLESVDFDLNSILSNLANIISVKARDKGMEIIYDMDKDMPALLKGDPMRLQQVLLNLINNAIKFSNKGHVLISSKIVKKLKNSVKIRFAVKDNGIGIAKKNLDKLFHIFSQADQSTTRRYGGSGLGLSICKKLVEMMGGEIGVTSKQDKGSTFFFTVNLGLTKQKKSTAFKAPVDLRGLRILIVDDVVEIRRVIHDSLEIYNFRSTEVTSAEEAISELRNALTTGEKHYDLVIMDWKLEGMNGIEAAKLIKADPEVAYKPKIILISAFMFRETMTNEDIKCIDSYLQKPFSLSELFNSIINVFGKDIEHKQLTNAHNKKDPLGVEKIKGARILLVEDNEINQQVAKETLENEGFWVTVTNNGREAVQKISSYSRKGSHFDLVLMDLQMPVMDGFQATRNIRKEKEHKGLPVIAMTADVVGDVQQKCLKAGMNDYISKPFEPLELFSTLVKWIKPGNREINKENVFSGQKTEINIPYPTIDYLDTKKGIDRLNGNTDAYIKIILKFKNSQQNVLSKIKEGIKDNRLEEVKSFVHAIKGVSGNLNADRLYRASINLEDSFVKGNSKKIADALDTFKKEFVNVMNGISEYENKMNLNQTTGKEVIKTVGVDIQEDLKLLSSTITELTKLLKDNNMRSKEVLGVLQKKARSTPAKELIEKIYESLDNYDFSTAYNHIMKFNKRYKVLN